MYKRTLFYTLKDRILEKRQFLQVVVGPRQIGKTTMLDQIVKEKLMFTRKYSAEKVANVDEDWLDGVWKQTRFEMERNGETEGLLIIDEIQNIDNWSGVVKKNWSEDTTNGVNLKLIISGSSRLLIQKGLNESLMGRYELSYLDHWSYGEMRQVFEFTPEQYLWFGGYPGAASLVGDEVRFKDYIRYSIIEPSIAKDILMLTNVDKPALLKQLFELGTGYSAQILSYTKILGQLQDVGNVTTLVRYATLLDQAGMLKGLEIYSNKLIKTKSSIPKWQTHNNGLISGLSPRTFDDVVGDSEYLGRLVESAVGSHLMALAHSRANVELYYWRERNSEVDFVLKYGDKVLAIEVKSRLSDPSPKNLRLFGERFSDVKTLLIGDSGVRWQDFLDYSLDDLF